MNHVKAQISLSRLVELLEKDFTDASHPTLVDAVRNLTVADKEIARYGCFGERRYSRNVVFRNADFEILMLCWKSGQRSAIHDHGGSFGIVKVLRGILTESVFVRALNGMIKAHGSRDYRAGDVQIEDASTIHQVSNLQPAGCDAVSLHVYLPPLRGMNIYTLGDGDARSVSAELYNYGSGI